MLFNDRGAPRLSPPPLYVAAGTFGLSAAWRSGGPISHFPASAAVPGWTVTIGNSVLAGAENFKDAVATCPPSTVVLGTGFKVVTGGPDVVLDDLVPSERTVGGAELFGSQGQVSIDELFPEQSSYEAKSFEDLEDHDGNRDSAGKDRVWGIDTFVICANLPEARVENDLTEVLPGPASENTKMSEDRDGHALNWLWNDMVVCAGSKARRRRLVVLPLSAGRPAHVAVPPTGGATGRRRPRGRRARTRGRPAAPGARSPAGSRRRRGRDRRTRR